MQENSFPHWFMYFVKFTHLCQSRESLQKKCFRWFLLSFPYHRRWLLSQNETKIQEGKKFALVSQAEITTVTKADGKSTWVKNHICQSVCPSRWLSTSTNNMKLVSTAETLRLISRNRWLHSQDKNDKSKSRVFTEFK